MLAYYPVTRPVRTTEPTFEQEPVTLPQAKKQCEVAEGITYHDEHLRQLIVSAREQVEHDTGLVCYTGTFTWKQTNFPHGEWIELPDIRPITAITSITYTDATGTTATWAAANYVLETSGVTQFVRLAYNQVWPTIRGDHNGIALTLAAGYATAQAVPQRVKQAVLFLVNHWFVSRDTVNIGTISPGIEMTYDALIAGLRRGSYP